MTQVRWLGTPMRERESGGYRQHLALAMVLARREVALRYRGSLFGTAWSLINPLVMLAVYGFVFAVVLQARWPGVAGSHGPQAYVVLLLSGLVLHAFLAECITRAPGQIVGNVNFVKKVVFPLQVIALAQWGAALFHLGINLLVLFAFQLVVFGLPPASVVLAPVVLLPLAAVGLGLMWLVSAFTVYFRDLGQVVNVLATLLLFLSPALYPLENVPEALRSWLYLNPLTPALELWRGATLWGQFPALSDWLPTVVVCLCMPFVGHWCFARLRGGFADVL